MAQKIHYQDDLFFLTLTIKTLRDGLNLDIDAHLFLEKTVQDLVFIGTALDSLFSSLRDNERLIDRQEYLRELENVQREYIDLLVASRAGPTAFSGELAREEDRLKSAIGKERDNLAETQKLIHEAGSAEPGDVDIVSQDELSELFREDEEDERKR